MGLFCVFGCWRVLFRDLFRIHQDISFYTVDQRLAPWIYRSNQGERRHAKRAPGGKGSNIWRPLAGGLAALPPHLLSTAITRVGLTTSERQFDRAQMTAISSRSALPRQCPPASLRLQKCAPGLWRNGTQSRRSLLPLRPSGPISLHLRKGLQHIQREQLLRQS